VEDGERHSSFHGLVDERPVEEEVMAGLEPEEIFSPLEQLGLKEGMISFSAEEEEEIARRAEELLARGLEGSKDYALEVASKEFLDERREAGGKSRYRTKTSFKRKIRGRNRK
jgi:hypothetical protein